MTKKNASFFCASMNYLGYVKSLLVEDFCKSFTFFGIIWLFHFFAVILHSINK